MTYNNLGNFYSDDADRRKETEGCYQEALEIYKRLAAAQPSVYEPDLAVTCIGLGLFYSADANQDERSEDYLQQAFAIAEKYRETNFCCAQIYDELKDYFG